MENVLIDSGVDNEIYAGDNIRLTGRVNGDGNRLFFAGSREPSIVNIELNGNNNVVSFKWAYALKELSIAIGSHIPAHQTRLLIGENFSIEGGGRILLYTSNGSLSIGDNCMFSSNVVVRCGESPHLIFDLNGNFLDAPKGISIGNHVWIGEDAYLTKSSSIASECIVGARSVVTRVFIEPYCAIAGNPAKVVRQRVQWIRNRHYLEQNSLYARNHDVFHAAFDEAHGAVKNIDSASIAKNFRETTEVILMRKVKALEAVIQCKDEKIARLHDEMQKFRQSTSWRVTRPLRTIRRLLAWCVE